tara:strand:+ start:2175 stop:3269 length:1095 start_codon:yes stop_codon:yes gene_type:complete
MSILFIGPYRQPDEWGTRSFNLLQSLKKTEANITSRPLFLANFPPVTVEEETEYTRFDNYDLLIQHSLPGNFIIDKSFKKNIGVIDLETIDISHSGWLYRLSFLDEVWVNSNIVKQYLERALPTNIIRNIGNSMDSSIVDFQNDQEFDGIDPERFKFYFIGNTEDKNGLEELLIAYYKSFTTQDRVQLVLFLPNMLPDSFEPIFQRCVQRAGALYEQALTPLVHVINANLNADQIKTAHRQCDCLVSPSYMLSTQSLPLEAAVFGNNPIITDGTGTAEVLTDINGWLIDSYEECCVVNNRPFADTFTAHETIRKPIIKSLANCLYEAYNNKYIRDKKKSNTHKLLQTLSHETVAEKLKDYVCTP